MSSLVKSRSWVEIKVRRFVASSFDMGGLRNRGAGSCGEGGIGGYIVGIAWQVDLLGGVGGGEGSRWI